MAQKISVGIDIGSGTIKVIVTESTKDNLGKPRIIGAGYAPSEGIRHGYIVNVEDAAQALFNAVSQAQKSSGYKIEKAYFSLGGVGLQGITNSATLLFGDKETVISASDIEQAMELCQNEIPQSDIRNREIIHAIPLSYKIDGKQVFGKPQGMVGTSFEIKAFFITTLSQHVSDLVLVAKMAGVGIEDVVASPVASSVALLTKSQRIAGCGLLTIGTETTSIGIFENGVPVAIEVCPIGSRDITNDIALGFKVSLEEAERIKVTRIESLPYPRRKIEEVVKARLEDICDFVQATLKKIGKQGLLPAGILITGGGSLNHFIETLAKEKLKLPTKKIGCKFDGETKAPIQDATWSVAYGLAMVGTESDGGKQIGTSNIFGEGKSQLSKILKSLAKLFKRILP